MWAASLCYSQGTSCSSGLCCASSCLVVAVHLINHSYALKASAQTSWKDLEEFGQESNKVKLHCALVLTTSSAIKFYVM